ncbi:MAG TPA: PQQ-binding-like beta-propeller repeat protein [Pseudonocardiaceae bacterium]
MLARVALVPVVAVGFCCVGLLTAFVGLRAVIGSASTAKLWLVLFVAAAVAALVFLRFARDDRGRVRLGVGWAVLGVVVVATTITRTPAPGAGAPISSGWAVLVAGGAAVVLAGIALAVSPVVRVRVHPAIVVAAVVAVVAVQVGGYAGAVSWTNGQNVHLTVADATPLRARESALDGKVQWSSQGNGSPVATAGGLLVAAGNALQMLDPATGKPRWSYRRADVTQIFDPVVSADGALVGALGFAPSLNPKPTPQGPQRLIVLDTVTGALVTDTPIDPKLGGTLTALTRTQAFFEAGPDGISLLQMNAVDLTGSHAGQQDWVYYPKDGCEINAFSAQGTEIAVSSLCGTVDMLSPRTGKPVWEYRAPTGGAQIWPLTSADITAGTVEAMISAQPTNNPDGLGVAGPSGVVTLDARTGAVRTADYTAPPAPFALDSPDSGTAVMTTFWAGDTAVLAYALQSSRRVWLVGYRRGAKPSFWSAIVPDLSYNVQFPTPGVLNTFIAATPDGRIVLPTQYIEDATDLNAHPTVIVVDGRTGRVAPGVTVGGPTGIPRSTGFFSPPAALPTPGGTVLAVVGVGNEAEGPVGVPFLLIGLH